MYSRKTVEGFCVERVRPYILNKIVNLQLTDRFSFGWMYIRLKSKIFKISCLLFRFLGIFIVLARNKILVFFLGLELKTFAALLLVFFYSDNNSNKARLYYYIVNVLASLGLLWGAIFTSKIIFLLGLFLKLRFFPFLWWFPYICESLRYWCFFFLKVVQKFIPITLVYVKKIISYEYVYMLIMVSYFISLLNLHYNQNNIKLFLVWSSSGKLCIILFFILFSWVSALMYFFIYRFLLGLFVYILKKISIYYWRDFIFSDVLLVWVSFFCLFNFMGFPPLLGFFIKVAFFLSFVYVSWRSFFSSLIVLLFVLVLLFLKMIVYVNLATKLMLVKISVFPKTWLFLRGLLFFRCLIRVLFLMI